MMPQSNKQNFFILLNSTKKEEFIRKDLNPQQNRKDEFSIIINEI